MDVRRLVHVVRVEVLLHLVEESIVRVMQLHFLAHLVKPSWVLVLVQVCMMGVMISIGVLHWVKFVVHERVDESVLHRVEDLRNRLGNCGGGVGHHFEERIVFDQTHELDWRWSCSQLVVLVVLHVAIQRHLTSHHIIQSRQMRFYYLSVLIHHVYLVVVWYLMHQTLFLLQGRKVIVTEIVLLLLQTVVDLLVENLRLAVKLVKHFLLHAWLHKMR